MFTVKVSINSSYVQTGMASLHDGAMNYCPDIAKLLLSYGADLHAITNVSTSLTLVSDILYNRKYTNYSVPSL